MRFYLFRQISRNRRDIPGLIWTLLAVVFIISMVYQPAVVFEGAAEGLKVWWEIIFPSLLPFFVASELLMKLGFVHFLGILLEPVMRPLFNVPGSGGFVLVMGLVGGSPINSLLTAQLREKTLCTKSEAERLICFTNFATPLFMLSAVAVGMLGRPELGFIIAGTHYLANLMIGVGLRFYKKSEIRKVYGPNNSVSIKKALVTMLRFQRQQKQTIGKLLNNAVTSSVLKLLNVGGFIILFGVIISIFTQAGLINLISSGFTLLLVPLGFSLETMPSIARGLFETTIGSTTVSEAAVTELQKIIAIGFMLGWSGLSVHAQVSSIAAKTDIGLRLFFITRIAHAFLTAALIWLLYPVSQHVINFARPTTAPTSSFYTYPIYLIIIYLFFLAFCLLIMLVFIAKIFQFCQQTIKGVRVWGNKHF
ncbi:sporulation integral membrane protein YlbJ [Candidatus Contubernalis alkaliaceticus]|uniref:sporulation integral membrane protein YlbJ n=1 Tax=Candidatus Contubernalis alkaliaceticus TaxID=338645 RepID=UPI001F4BDE12|nr:sporulation integral membrane protein YlbJ [Candidatus Contubernalis alkalaceticus]UNC90647.1 sporulation integral membrane protein YlbJ [Candidatus Contubernalis alkalaceticus]